MVGVSTLFAAVMMMSGVSCTEYGRDLAAPGDGEIIPVDVALDRDSMIVVPGTPDPPQDCFQQSINLHVFNRSLVAIKNVDKKVCYIKPSSETYQEVAARLHHKGPQAPIRQVTEEWAIGKELIKDVESRFGSRIANFCNGYEVFRMEDGHVINAVARRNKQAAAGSCNFCWKCKSLVR